jgi:NAD+ kinase
VSVTFVVNDANDGAVELAAAVAERLVAVGQSTSTVAISALSSTTIEDCSTLVSLGGDGTFLATAAIAHRLDIPVAGVNFGRLGYLLALQPEDLAATLTAGLTNDFRLEHRHVLCVQCDVGDGSAPSTHVAINEVAVEKPHPGHMVQLATVIDGASFQDYAADGVLVATATGSTGYNVSAGGPVLAPDLAVMVLTPVAPHLAVDRSVVVGGPSRIEITVTGGRRAVAVIDGVKVADLAPGATVSCALDPRPLKMVAAGSADYVGRLRSIFTPGAS